MSFLFPGLTPEELIPSSKQQLFITLKNTVITKDLQHKIAPEERPRERNSRRTAEGSHVGAATNTSDVRKMWENRFASLCNLEEQDSQDDDK